MEILVLSLAFLVMLLGLVGVVVPVLPGLLIVWLVGVTSLLWQGGGPVGWGVVTWLTVLFAGGTVATIALPARRGRAAGASPRSLGPVVLGATIGVVVLPVFGLLVGALAGLYLGEWGRLGDRVEAGRSTRAVLAGYGIGVLLELVFGTVMLASWLLTVVLRAL
ncbi:MAG: DUF456 domain-containing protein [Nitriliruptoraceae bacterium]